jgi:hypothetical protein
MLYLYWGIQMENEIMIYTSSYQIKILRKFKLIYNNITIKVKLALLPIKYHAIKIYKILSYALLKSALDEMKD